MKVCALDGCDVPFQPRTCQRYCCPDHRRAARKCVCCGSVVDTKSPHCRPCGAEIARLRRLVPAARASAVNLQRFKKYGITVDDYAALNAQQNGVCAICGQPETALRRGEVKTLAVDHDHDTGRVRGLLCQNCNTAIGLLGDDPERLNAAAEYLRKREGW